MNWVKREAVESPAKRFYSDIWDGDGWQINKSAEPGDKPYLLIDAVMPHIPASAVMGSFATLEQAQQEAERRGRPDWSDFDVANE